MVYIANLVILLKHAEKNLQSKFFSLGEVSQRTGFAGSIFLKNYRCLVLKLFMLAVIIFLKAQNCNGNEKLVVLRTT